ncbi:hypothetical protein C7H19_09720 [Aphanothece hegewaldii CCALA 016]|uniref:Uncharacterized protein n=1 Tax=Aphanothece hegewaldii CCALA 016 TaxID=2107694 RepID=A0A2T1LYG5_9CHRO|nr:hypothetical protein [Aphanothece hegewaldii]PSF37440.1 hypothetical protein C7H19_09720 [Aphanothece hegewaldii CCALA 016]
MNTVELKNQFAICVSNQKYEDLEVWKVYRVLLDDKASELGCLRVIDESGEDYLYPASRFVVVELPEEVQARLMAVVENSG